MPRKLLIRTDSHPYHVYNRVQSKKFYPDDLKAEVWQIYCDAARVLTWAFGVRIQMMVVMSNHYHMIFSTPDQNIDTAMMYFQREISRRVNCLVGSQDYRFGARYKWKLIDNPTHYVNTYMYVAQNPVVEGLADSAASYPYSTLAGVFGHRVHHCPCFPCSIYAGLLPDQPADLERWVESASTCEVPT